MDDAEHFYQEFIEPIEDRMMATVTRLVRDPDDAEDVFQNALEKIWRNLARIQAHSNPSAYILRLCTSMAYDQLRRCRRRQRREINWPEGMEATTPNKANEDLVRKEVLEAISSLPRRQAEALVLRALEGESFEAIAQAMNCSNNTARSNFSKGRARLRELLKHEMAGMTSKERRNHERRTA